MSDPTERPECQHENFFVDAKIVRLTEGEGGPVGDFMVDLTAKCTECNLPFRWKGVPMGYDFERPMMSVDRLTLSAPIEPDTAEAIERIERKGARGFTIRQAGPIGKIS